MEAVDVDGNDGGGDAGPPGWLAPSGIRERDGS